MAVNAPDESEWHAAFGRGTYRPLCTLQHHGLIVPEGLLQSALRHGQQSDESRSHCHVEMRSGDAEDVVRIILKSSLVKSGKG